MLETEARLIEPIKKGQQYARINGQYIYDYKHFVRHYTGALNNIVKGKRTIDMASAVFEIEKLLDIINPSLILEIEWFKDVIRVLKEWHNNKVNVDRLLGIKYYQGD